MARSKEQAPTSTLQAYQDKVAAQLRDAKATLDVYEAKARAAGSRAHAQAISSLKTAKTNIDQRLKDLKAASAQTTSRAKADIDADVATFKASIDRLSENFR